MKKVTLLMLTVMMSVFAFAQEIQQIPLPGLKKQPSLKQQILEAKREGKQLNKETIAQFKVMKPATSQLAKKNRPALNSNEKLLEMTASASTKAGKKLNNAVSSREMTPQTNFNLRRAAEDYPIITEAPEGTLKTYKRSGDCTFVSDGSAYIGTQSGKMEIVFAENNEVYMKNPVCGYNRDTYVKGNLSEDGKTITVPLGQNLYYNSNYDAAVAIAMANYSAEVGITHDLITTQVTYTINDEAGTITINGTSDDKWLTCFWTDDDSWTGYSEWNTVLTEFTPPSPVTPPAELVTEAWFFGGYFIHSQTETPVEKTLNIGVVEKDVYVQGLSYYMPEAWIKGTLSEDGKSITFASSQYYGAYANAYDMWFAAAAISADGKSLEYLPSLTVAFDAENGAITLPESTFILENSEEGVVFYWGYYDVVAIIKGATPPAPNVAPEGLTTAEWSLKSLAFVQDADTGETGYEEYNYHVQVGFVENDVYILGLVDGLSDAVVKGTLDTETNKITFATGQCIGVTYDIDWENWTYVIVPVYFTGYSANGLENLVMTYDPATKTMTMDNDFMIVNGSWLLLNPYTIQTEVSITEIPDVAAVPAQPEIVWSDLDPEWYPNIYVDVPQIGANGEDLLTSKLFYQYWIEVEGVQTPLTFDPAEYTRLSEPMTEIPCTFSDSYDIYTDHLYLNQDYSAWKKIGIQSIYYGGGEKKSSEIAWRVIANYTLDESFDNTKGDLEFIPKALEGEKVILNINPKNGYKISKVTARVGKTNIKVDEEIDEETGETTYSIITPPADVIVNAEFDVTPADFELTVAPGNISDAIDALLAEGMIIRGLTLNLSAGDYTITKPIEAAGNIVINGNGAVIDASAIVGGEDGSASAPFIQLSTTPQVGFAKKAADGTDTDYYLVDNVTVKDVTVNGLKNSIFFDNNTKYVVAAITFDNVFFTLATEAVQNEALISFQAGGAKDINITNSTFIGNNAVAKYFVRYNNSARLDRYGYDKSNDFQTMTYTNNTFYGLLIADGQWGNYNGISGQMYSKFDIQNNIWFNCGENIIRRLGGGRFNGANPMTFKNNTYFNNGVDESAGETGYDKSGTILTSDPKFEDAANGDFSVRNKTQQAENQTGDWNRWGQWIVDVYEINVELAEDANGEIKAPQYAQENEEIELEVIPAEGYRLVEGSLKVFIGKSEIELDGNKFNMPAADVKVTGEFELIPVFAVTVAATIENGTVVADKQEAAEGEVVKLTITPAEGFELDYITVTGVNTNIAVPVENNQFTMPADAVNINAAFKATATGIQAIAVDKLDNATIYTLQGVRVEKTQITKGGVYIVNGRKAVIK